MNKQEVKSKATILQTTRVVPIEIRDDGTSVLMISTDTITLSIKSPEVDTTVAIKEMIGKRTRVTLSRLGDFTRREVIDTVKLSGMMGTVAQREFIHFPSFPAKPVKMGEKWTATRPDTNVSMGSTVVSIATIEYELVGKERLFGKEGLKISYAGTISISGKGSMMGGTFFIAGSGTTSGTLLVDPASGLSLSEHSQRDMESAIAVTGQQTMTIPSSQSVTLHRILLTQ
jgi:hypothetical protein